MPQIEFSSQLARHVDCPEEVAVDVSNQLNTLDDVFGVLFASHPKLREYLVDEQDVFRNHITIFVDGTMLSRNSWKSTPIANSTEIFVMQAVAGG